MMIVSKEAVRAAHAEAMSQGLSHGEAVEEAAACLGLSAEAVLEAIGHAAD